MDAGFVLPLLFHHEDLEPVCVGVSTRAGDILRRIKIPLQDCALKVKGGLMREGDVFAGHYAVMRPQGMHKGNKNL